MAGSKILGQAFQQAFSHPAQRFWRAPGRVNLIGEHTDYNLGFVMPIAIGLECRIASGPNPERELTVLSVNMQESRTREVSTLASIQPAGDWSDYVFGVARELAAAGVEIKPMRLAIHSTVPIGSGLSSSAAIEVSTALALLDGREFDRVELALLCQRAERNFAGVPCGIMDQYVSVFARPDHAVELDCRSLTHKDVRLPQAAIIAVNSMVKHDLGESAYPRRVQECATAVRALQQKYPNTKSLRDITAADLDAARSAMDAVTYRRALHVVTENQRVEDFAAAAARGDLRRMGELFVDSHTSLSRDYEVSCEELDFLVDAALGLPGVYGSRMTGGGFGGCTVNLVDLNQAENFAAGIAEAYRRRYREPQIYHCAASPGASEA